MSNITAVAPLLESLFSALPEGQKPEFSQHISEALNDLAVLATYVNELAYHSSLSEVQDSGHKVAFINLTLAELSNTLITVQEYTQAQGGDGSR